MLVSTPHNKGGIMGGGHQKFEDPNTWTREIMKTKFDLLTFFEHPFSLSSPLLATCTKYLSQYINDFL
jgi:hypothetical protein